MRYTRLTFILLAASVMLLIPYIAMQFDSGVDWDIRDFTTMGILLYGTGLLCELLMRVVKSVRSRLIVCGLLLFVLFLTWAELAVGIFGSPFAGS